MRNCNSFAFRLTCSAEALLRQAPLRVGLSLNALVFLGDPALSLCPSLLDLVSDLAMNLSILCSDVQAYKVNLRSGAPITALCISEFHIRHSEASP